jgi:hypothetical protein
MQVIENYKIHTLVRIIRHALNTHPTMKIVVGASYIHTLETVKNILEESPQYGEVVLVNGEVKMSERPALIFKFQESNTKCRVMVGNLKTISTGIDLDDQDGRFPRLALILPNYEAITQYQFAGRIMRLGTKSNAILLTIYAKTYNQGKDFPQNDQDYQKYPLPCNIDAIVKDAKKADDSQGKPSSNNDKETYVLSMLAKKSNVILETTGDTSSSNNMLSGIAPKWIE